MPTLKVFEAAPSGLNIEPCSLRLDVDLAHLKQSGASLQRFNLRDHREVFGSHPELLAGMGNDADSLPLFMVDDRVVSQGSYPSRQQMAEWAQVTLPQSGGCGGAGGCTCAGS